MKKKLLFVLAAALVLQSAAAWAQSSPGLYNGQVPTAAQWNSYFIAKQDALGYTPLNKAGDAMLGKLNLLASSTTGAGINCGVGSAPTSPVNGDIWCTAVGVYARINGGTVGPMAGLDNANVWTDSQEFQSTIKMTGLPTSDPGYTGYVWNYNGWVVLSGVGVLPTASFPALTGDVTKPAGSAATTIATNAVGNSKLAQMDPYKFKGNYTGSIADPTDFSIGDLTDKPSPAAGDYVMVQDNAAGGTLKRSNVSSLVAASGVASIDGYIGIFVTANGVVTDSSQVIKNNVPSGQAQLTYVGATQLSLVRNGGYWLWINGQNEAVPSAGVSMSNGGLSASTLYYIYAYMSGGTMTLEASTTTYAQDSNDGHMIKSGDATRSLVGMVSTNGSSQFTSIVVRSWYRDPGVATQAPLSSDQTTASTSYVEISSSLRVSFLSWAGEQVKFNANGAISNNTNGQFVETSINVDGSTNLDTYNFTTIVTASYNDAFSVGITRTNLSEGLHYATLIGRVAAASTGTWRGSGTAASRTMLEVSIPPRR